jgi:Family of unknown function (DUF6132)
MELLKSKIVRKWSKIFLPILLGGAAGYLYYSFVGCTTGTCPITSNPWLSTGYGAFAGFVFISLQTNKKGTDN